MMCLDICCCDVEGNSVCNLTLVNLSFSTYANSMNTFYY